MDHRCSTVVYHSDVISLKTKNNNADTDRGGGACCKTTNRIHSKASRLLDYHRRPVTKQTFTDSMEQSKANLASIRVKNETCFQSGTSLSTIRGNIFQDVPGFFFLFLSP